MFEIYENILCVHGGWLYKVAKVMDLENYKNYCRRGPFQVLRKGYGRKPALIAWRSIQDKYKKQIIDTYGDPEAGNKAIIFADYLERDPKGVQFFANYTLDTGQAIPEDIQSRYAIEAAIFNAIHRVIHDRILRTRALGSGGLTATWKRLAEVVQNLPRHTWPHSLPRNHRSLQRKYKAYMDQGYEALVHGGHGHKNSEKLTDPAKQWVLSRWAQQDQKAASLSQLLDEYNEMAILEDWKLLKEEKTLYNYLYAPEVKSLWYGHRYGQLKAKEKYIAQISTRMPSMRDSLWYSDGTKLNLYYEKIETDKKTGKTKRSVATCFVYEVMDAYSEVLLGYHIAPAEDFKMQYHAFKMAVQNAGHRPYEVKFDNQGGHKKLEAGKFMGKLSNLAIRTQPYNGKSKTIESAFGRFQSQILKKLWYFTGQNITARKDESQANMDFILANSHKLPSLEQVKEQYAACRMEWNSQPHHKTGVPRLEMYHGSHNPQAPEITLFEMVDIFWVERPQPVTCTAFGISFKENKVKHDFMIYKEDGMVDQEFLYNHIDRKFYIKYDPDDMSLIYLYEQTPLGLRFVHAAQPKVTVARGRQEQDEFERSYIVRQLAQNKEKHVEQRDKMDEILEAHGMAAEQNGLISPHLKGIERKKRAERADTYGQLLKRISNAEPATALSRAISEYEEF